MINAPIKLQDLRRKIYVKAKTEPSWRFWGLYVHVCKTETLYEAYRLAKRNNGAPGLDGVTFEAIEARGAAVRRATRGATRRCCPASARGSSGSVARRERSRPSGRAQCATESCSPNAPDRIGT